MWQARGPLDCQTRNEEARGVFDGNQEDHEKMGDPVVLCTITCEPSGLRARPIFHH